MKVLLRTNVRHGMGTVVFFGASLLLANHSNATPSVEVITCEVSSQKARITIDLNGRRAKDVHVIVSSFGGRPLQKSLSVEQSGLVILPRLAPGQYLVNAGAPENQGAAICVDISAKKVDQVSLFSLALHPVPSPGLTLEQMLAIAGRSAPSEQMQQFNGVLIDPSGATIPGADIQIFPKGARVRDEKRSVKVKTGSRGDFSVALPHGIYTAVFMSPGFKQKIVTFQISRTGSPSGMRITLPPGEAT